MSNLISVVIITKNEERFIEHSIKSAHFANEVIVLDCGSTDDTCIIARNLGARVEHQDWLGFGAQKNKAIELAKNDWIFVLDADERITSELSIEIQETIENPVYDGLLISRLNYFFGKYIKTCGLYPDYSVRLFNKNKGYFNNVPVHESVQISGRIGKLKNHMIHHAYETFDEFVNKQKYYASLSPKKKNIVKAIIGPLWVFFKIYIIRLGFIDGNHGYRIAIIYSKYTYWKYIK
jgi:glycosyltransferase involved in cell wall biosynthesis